MISFIELIKKLKEEDSTLNWDGLVELCNAVEMRVVNFKVNVAGMSLQNSIYIDVDALKRLKPYEVYYMILHELGHNKRNKNADAERKLIEYRKYDFEIFFEFLINEEITADRYAKTMFYILNRATTNYGQYLHLESKKNEYRNKAMMMYKTLPDNVKDYHNYLLSIIAQ